MSTDRLEASDRHELADRYDLELVEVITQIMTAATTTALPPAWRGDFDRVRTSAWIDERDAESTTLLVVERDTGRAMGIRADGEQTFRLALGPGPDKPGPDKPTSSGAAPGAGRAQGPTVQLSWDRAPSAPDLTTDDNGVTYMIVCAGGPMTTTLARLQIELDTGRRSRLPTPHLRVRRTP